MTTFTRAIEAEVGGAVTSRHMARMARAFNDRLRSGLGDFPWRIVFYHLSLFRQMRNPDSTGYLWPAQAEFFEAFQMLEPTSGTWPVAEAGMPEGANVSNPLCLYIWGNEGARIYDEPGRLGDVPLVLPGGRAPETIGDYRLLGKLQRGAADLGTGAAVAPAFLAARSWSAIRHDWLRTPHGSAYGGWHASPDLQTPDCEDPNPFDELPAPPNYALQFTVTAAGAAAGYANKSYAGTCWLGPAIAEGQYADHVYTVLNTPWSYLVYLNNGTVDVLPKAYYVEGPYYGAPKLKKTEGGQLARVLQAFASEWRGIEQNRLARSALHAGAADQASTWLDDALDVQEFLTRQYLLSPARGQTVQGGVMPVYPRYQVSAPAGNLALNEGTVIKTFPGLKSAHTVAAGCAVCGGWVKATALSGDVTVEFLYDGNQVGNARLTVEEPEAIVPFVADVPAGHQISLRLGSVARFSNATGKIEAEVDELIEYKPDLSDWFLVTRLSTGE
jgi:hypothetical protein